jgi:THO complex subunit 7
VRRANTRELETYEKKQQQVEQRIKQTTEDISRLRGELELARIERNHKEEYDLLARKILELPSRQESLAAAKALDGEIAELETEAQRLESTIDLRSKQFALVMHLIRSVPKVFFAVCICPPWLFCFSAATWGIKRFRPKTQQTRKHLRAHLARQR